MLEFCFMCKDKELFHKTSAAYVIVKSQIHNLNKLSQTLVPVFSVRVAGSLLAGLMHVVWFQRLQILKITTLTAHD